jgi:RHS repeat-associated protein
VTSLATTSNTLATDTQCFSYDYLRNLTSAWTPSSNNCATAKSATALGGPAPYWTDYAVSPQTGNRTSSVEHPVTGTATTDTFAYPAAGASNPHAVQSVAHTGGTTGTSSYGYDAAGDTTARPGQSLGYDNEGKIATVIAGSASESNVYDASGALLLQTDSTTGSTLFLGSTELHETTGSSTASAVRTYSANGTPIAERTTAVGVSGSKLTWLATDAQGTVDMQVDAVTGVAASRLQDPFGQARGTSTAAWSDGHGFLNAPTGALTSLTQLGARMYDASLGRFLSVDPVLSPSDPQQNNGYSYAHNDPVSMSDPTGLDPNIASSCNTLACRNGMYVGNSGKAPAAAGNSVSLSKNVEIGSKDQNRKQLKYAYTTYQSFIRVPQSDRDNPYNQLTNWRDICAATVNVEACSQQFRSLLAASTGNNPDFPTAAELAAGGEIRLDGSKAAVLGSVEWSEVLTIEKTSPTPSDKPVVASDASPVLPRYADGKTIAYSYYGVPTPSGVSVSRRVAIGSDGSAYFSTDNFRRPERIYPLQSGFGTAYFSPGIAAQFGYDDRRG